MTFQEFIHKWEVGAGQRLVKGTAAILAFVGLAVWYDVRAFKGISTAEGLDAAQLGRNISRGEGYTTRFIRPFSLYLVDRHERAARDPGAATSQPRPAETNQIFTTTKHPDLANAPVYPLLLGGVLKAMPFDYPDLITARAFSVYSPDVWIAGFNQLLLLGVLLLVFRMARSLFDSPVAWLSVLIVAGTQLYWQLTGAGHGTVLLMGLVVAILMVVARLDRIARGEEGSPPGTTEQRKMLLLAGAAGLLMGLAALTRYSMALLTLPVIGALASLPGAAAVAVPGSVKRATLVATAAVVFLLLVAPWVIRNYAISGTLFGTAGYAVAADAGYFAGDELDRSLKPDLNRIEPDQIWGKIVRNTGELIHGQLPIFAGSWVTALFLAGLLMPFRNPTLSRVRWVLVAFVATLLLAQAGGKTGLSKDAPLVSSENLLVVAGPASVIFAAGFLSVLLQGLVGPALRLMVAGLVAGLVWLPLLISLTSSSHSDPGQRLLHYPPSIQEKALVVQDSERIMSDVPAAVTWYGDRTSIWLSLTHKSESGNDFYSLHAAAPVSALYLTGEALNAVQTSAVAQWREENVAREGDDWAEFLNLASSLMKNMDQRKDELEALRRLLQLADQHWAYGSDRTWPEFLLGIYVNSEVPTGFPLKRAPFGLWPELFLSIAERNAGN